MKRYRGKKWQLSGKGLLLLMTILCLVLMLSGLIFNISGGPLHAAAGYVFVPMQKGITSVGEAIRNKTKTLQTLSKVQKENEALQKEVEELASQLNAIRLNKYELDNLRRLLELDEKYPSYEKVAARVIAKNSGNWFTTFTIDKGSNDGIQSGMNVLSGGGLVGIITEAGPNFSKVKSIIDDSSNVSCMLTSTLDTFNVSGNLQMMKDQNVITFRELRDEQNAAKEGDPVVTSHISDRFQQGILIGYIATIRNDPNNLTKSGTITPVVDFRHMEEVLIIKNIKALGDTGKPIRETSDTEQETTETGTTETNSTETEAMVQNP